MTFESDNIEFKAVALNNAKSINSWLDKCSMTFAVICFVFHERIQYFL